MNILIGWVVSALIIIVLAFILPGVAVAGFFVALVLALVLGLINGIIRPVALFLTLPLNFLTLGLFTLVVDAVLIMLAARIVPGFDVENFWWALLFSVVLSIVNGLVLGNQQAPVRSGRTNR